MTRFPALALCVVAVFAATGASAGLLKTGVPTEKGFEFYVWPKVAVPKGWHQDDDASYQQDMAALAPDGTSFAKTGVVMYAEAPAKPDDKKATLASFIAGDLKGDLEHDPGTLIKKQDDWIDADGQHLRVYTFTPVKTGRWDIVAYGEEGQYFLTFALSARTKADYGKYLPAFTQMVKAYAKGHDTP